MAVCIFGPRTWETKAKSEFKASLVYLGSSRSDKANETLFKTKQIYKQTKTRQNPFGSVV